ncbi:MAG TPA: TIGR00645 family protein [Candidatus Acidoferrum sp.]|nr:TIGR00645 family protein [Candidatus Acidoferrum sp.]
MALPLDSGTTVYDNRRVKQDLETQRPPSRSTLASFIFLSRWLQAPLYVGLIIAQSVYVCRFLVELWHLIAFALFGHAAPRSVPTDVKDTEVIVMLLVLGLIDVVMIANLLIMVIVGGYETFVSRLNLSGHPDQPEWLSHVNAGILKVKLATALIGISSIHLLKTFITPIAKEVDPVAVEMMTKWQVIIHVTFVFSAIALAWIDRLTARITEEKH